MKKVFLFFAILLWTQLIFAQTYQLNSPDNKILLEINVQNGLNWKLFYEEKPVITDAKIALFDKNPFPDKNGKPTKKYRKNVHELVNAQVPVKFKRLKTTYNSLILTYKNKSAVEFRLYNEGLAYRYKMNFKGNVQIDNETLKFSMPEGSTAFFPEEESMISHYERMYLDTVLSAIEKGKFASLPVLFKSPEGVNLLFTEADLHDYAGMFLEIAGKNTLQAKFPKVPLKIEVNTRKGADRNEIITEEAGYIAQTSGKRNLPWRVFIVSKQDKDLLKTQMVYNLSRKNVSGDFSWVKPGKVAWDWWNFLNITGVDFKSGINTETYKYYINFASDFGLDYIIMDEGWSKTTTNLLETNPEINMPELMAYARKKKVGIILWVLWKPLNENMEQVLDTFAAWGAKGVKVDFMQRSDQLMVNFYERTAREAAKRHLLVDFHGAFKPSGLRAEFPNVLSYEGVKGLENDKWSDWITPKHDCTIPFIRMAAGPMDYTPGAMSNAHLKNFKISWERPMSQGTRAHQIAMYVLYESPLQMLADNPSAYKKEQECTSFIAKIPTVWDETIPLDAKIAEYLVVARRNGKIWYIGALGDEKEHEFTLDLSFLPVGKYQMEFIADGINADKNAEDYKHDIKLVEQGDKINIKLASGGGWAGILKPVK